MMLRMDDLSKSGIASSCAGEPVGRRTPSAVILRAEYFVASGKRNSGLWTPNCSHMVRRLNGKKQRKSTGRGRRIRTSTDGVRVRAGALIFQELFPTGAKSSLKRSTRWLHFPNYIGRCCKPGRPTIEVSDGVGARMSPLLSVHEKAIEASSG